MWYRPYWRCARAAACLLMLTTIPAWGVVSVPVPNDGLANAGFEEPLGPHGEIPGWDIFAREFVEVRDGDDGGDFPIYDHLGIAVPALSAERSLLLGLPQDAHGHQPKGFNKVVSNPFVATEGELTLRLRLFSFETHGNDRVFFEIEDTGFRCADASCENVEYADHPADLSHIRFRFEQLESTAGSRRLEEVTHLCTTGPHCQLAIDIGDDRTPLYDSGIYELTIDGIDPDRVVSLRMGLRTTHNTRRPTWLYLDDGAAPPEAVIRVNPGDTPDQPALEGDFVVADCLESEGVGLRCDWSASGGGWASPRTVEDQDIAFFWFPDDQPVTLTLTVTAADGQSSSVSRSLNIINAEPAVNALNVEILSGTAGTTICRFADPGIGRYDDDGLIPGGEELHYLVGGGTELESQQESEASFTSGFFRVAVGPGGAVCQIQDSDGATGSDAFSVFEVDPGTLTSRLGDEGRVAGVGGNDTIASAFTLRTDWTYVAALGDPTDIDVYRIVSKDGTPLAAGSELVVALEGLPADYDLLVLSNGGSTEASPFFNAPFFNAPFFNAPFFNAPFFNAPFFNAQFNSVPFFNAPFFNAPFFNAPFFNAPVKKSPFFNAGDPSQVFNRAFDELPLSEVGLAAPDGSNVSSSDISVTEVGSLSLRDLQSTPGISLKALSAEPSLGNERVLFEVGPSETEIYVAVVGNGLAFSATQPYELTVEASTPPSQKQLLEGTGFCGPEPTIPGDLSSPPLYGSSWTAAASGDPAAGSVLILTQRERFEIEQTPAAAAAVASGTFLSEAAFWSNFWAGIDAYAAEVGGTVVSIDGALFENADQDPCNVATRNALVNAIRNGYIIDPASGSFRNPSLESVVIIGGQNILPPLAVPDESLVGNEADFTTDLWVRPGTPLSVATAEGYNLTDAVFTDLEPTPYRGRELYLEDRPVARLVERPAEILGKLDAFFALRAGSAANFGRLAYGYDFFCDGTAEVAALLGVDGGNVGSPCAGGSAWTADDLTQDWLNGGTATCLEASAADPLEIAAINAHMTTYGALSAFGYAEGLLTGDFDDVVPAATAAQCLDGTLTLTIGCHSGLNIPDRWALPGELNLPFDPALDWTELLGFMLAPRGYGLGDNTVADRLTEGIITLVVEELNLGLTLGEALVNAKRRYIMGLNQIDVHDEDSLINLALFAPPQLTFPPRSLGAFRSSSSAANATESGAGTLALTITENRADGRTEYLVGSETTPETLSITRFDDLNFRGSFFQLAPGGAQAAYGRALQPATLPFEDRPQIEAPDGNLVHGVALVARTSTSPCPINSRSSGSCNVAATYSDLGGPDADNGFTFNPVFPLPQHDWLVYEDGAADSGLEPFSCVEALIPTQLGVATTLDTGERVSQSLIVGTGQFRCDPETSTDQVLGQQRLFDSLNLETLYPVGSTPAAARAIDGDFDPPQVSVQSVISDPITGNVTATLEATDALTGDNGIREIIALVYWDAGASNAETGIVESYSLKPESLNAEPFGGTIVLENAIDQRIAFQYVDGAGNLTQKSDKGTLIRPVPVEILEADISITSMSTLAIAIGDFCTLQSPTISYRIDDGSPTSFTIDNPPAGVSIAIEPEGDCDATLIVEGIDFAFTAYGDSALFTVEIRAPGAIGSDSEPVAAPPVIVLELPLLPSGTVAMDYPDQTFRAFGGVGGFRWSVSNGALPPGLRLTQADDSEEAVLSGGPTAFTGSPYEFTITATDAGGISESAEVAIEVYPPPILIDTTELPEGQQGFAYLASLSASGGSGTAAWRLTSGSLPAGLDLLENGNLEGTPLDFGEFPVTATLDDENPNVVDISVDLTLIIFPPPLMIDTATLADGRVGENYLAELTAIGGSGTAEWILAPGSELPAGLELISLSANRAELRGTPTAFTETPVAFSVILDDADETVEDVRVALTIRILPAPLLIETDRLPNGTKGERYRTRLVATG
ncbi:MAG: putative Ig domain-containing protein, partial [Pseudomonadota bacterium]